MSGVVELIPDERMPSRWFRVVVDGTPMGKEVFGAREPGFVYTDRHNAARDLGWHGFPLQFGLSDLREIYQAGVAQRAWERMGCVESAARKLENDRYLHSTPQILRSVVVRRMHDERVSRHIISAIPGAKAKEMRQHPRRKSISIERRQELEILALNRAMCVSRRWRRMQFLWYQEAGFPWPIDISRGQGSPAQSVPALGPPAGVVSWRGNKRRSRSGSGKRG